MTEANLDYIDNLLMAIISVSFPVPFVGQYLGLDTRILWFPVISYIAWILYKAYLRPKVLLSGYPEKRFIEQVRAWFYATGLLMLLLSNGLTMMFFPGDLGKAGTIVLILFFILNFLVSHQVTATFRVKMSHMNKEQERNYNKILKDTGIASAYIALCIIIISILLITGEIRNLNPPLYTTVLSLAFIYGLFMEWRSSKLTSKLVISLTITRQYERIQAA